MKLRLSRIFVLLALVSISANSAAYDRQAAADYAQTWYNSNLNNDKNGNANHINDPNSVFHSSSTGFYLWYFNQLKAKTTFFSDPGTGTIPEATSKNCANFVSQALINGGLQLPLPDGAGNTITGAARLGCTLAGASQVSSFYTLGGVPGNLTTGDVVVWDMGSSYHATVVVGGTGQGVTLAAHGNDHYGSQLTGYLGDTAGLYPHGTAYHILTTAFTACQPTTNPLIFITSHGAVIADGGIVLSSMSVQVAGQGAGLSRLAVMTGSPSFNTDMDVMNGVARVLFQDDSFNSQNNPPAHTIDLSSLAPGTTIYVAAFDINGNAAIQTVFIQGPPSTLTLSDGFEDLYDGASGALTGLAVAPSTQLGPLSYEIDSPAGGAPIASVVITGPDGGVFSPPFDGILNSGSLPPNTTHLTGSLPIGPGRSPLLLVSTGAYAMTIVNTDGATTVAPFTYVSMNAVLTTGSSAWDSQLLNLAVTSSVTFNASQGLYSFTCFNSTQEISSAIDFPAGRLQGSGSCSMILNRLNGSPYPGNSDTGKLQSYVTDIG